MAETRTAHSIGFLEFVVLAAATMSTQAIAIDAMLPAFPTIVSALQRRRSESRSMDRHRLHDGVGRRAIVLGHALRSIRPQADLARRLDALRHCRAAVQFERQLSGAARMAFRAWPGGCLRHRDALGGAGSVFRTADGAGHVADLRGIPDGADSRAELGAADPICRPLALYFRGVRGFCRDGGGLGIPAPAGNSASRIPHDADAQARAERGQAGARHPRVDFLHARHDGDVRNHHGLRRHGGADFLRGVSPAAG